MSGLESLHHMSGLYMPETFSAAPKFHFYMIMSIMVFLIHKYSYKH